MKAVPSGRIYLMALKYALTLLTDAQLSQFRKVWYSEFYLAAPKKRSR